VLLAEARLALSDEDAERAEPLLEQAAALADRAYALETFIDAKGMLADVYRVTGRLLEAAEAAESGLAQVELARLSDSLPGAVHRRQTGEDHGALGAHLRRSRGDLPRVQPVQASRRAVRSRR